MAVPAGFPDASTTGVPEGTVLKTYTGPMTITRDGTVIENMIINGSLKIEAENVIIKNCRINFDGWWGVDAEEGRNITIQDCDIVGPGYDGDSNSGIIGSGKFLRNDISRVENGISLSRGSSTVVGNYIHDLEDSTSDPHYDGISVQGGQNGVLIENNTVIARDTSNIIIKNDFGSISDITVRNNFLGGEPGYNIYVIGATGVSITGNTIMKGYYGYYSTSNASAVITGNIELLQGAAIPNPPNIIIGTTGDDFLPLAGQSNAGNETLRGLGGNDVLVGGRGADTLDGGAGVDTASYVGSSAPVNVNLQNGTASGGHAAGDTFISIENLTGSKWSDTLVGNGLSNVLHDGGGGTDRLNGLGGNDTYRIFNSDALILEGASEGALDKVLSAVDYTLKAGVHVEFLATNGSTSTDPINLTGNALKQEIIGNYGDNVLRDGGGVGDVLKGLAGDDTYQIYSSGTAIVESANGGSDRVMAAVDYTLGKGVYVELMTTNGNAGLLGIDLTGNEYAQKIMGNAGSNVLDGKGGADALTGLGGKDFFVFSSPLGSGNVDRITDFAPVDDTIRLENAVFTALTTTGTLSSAAFRANATGLAADSSDRIIYETDTGKLFYDADGLGGSAGIHFATLTGTPTITNADFSVI